MKQSAFFTILLSAVLVTASYSTWAQTTKTMVVEEGGSGPFKAEVVSDASLPTHTIYRPADMAAAVKENGKLPVILYANGGCANTNVEIRYFLNELASHGYIAIAIGPYDEEDFFSHWRDVLRMMGPKSKPAVMANGETVPGITEDELKQFLAHMDKQRKTETKVNESPAPQPFQTYPGQLLEAMDWITTQSINKDSEYYCMIDLDKVAAMGQSCGGAQVLSIAHDPRVKTCVILNSGVGDMGMQGASKGSLAFLHTPMLYIVGGPDDMASENGKKDFRTITDVPVCLIDTAVDGHEGSYYEKSGGAYAVAVCKWLDWQLKGKIGQSALFLDDLYVQNTYPQWTIMRKNF